MPDSLSLTGSKHSLPPPVRVVTIGCQRQPQWCIRRHPIPACRGSFAERPGHGSRGCRWSGQWTSTTRARRCGRSVRDAMGIPTARFRPNGKHSGLRIDHRTVLSPSVTPSTLRPIGTVRSGMGSPPCLERLGVGMRGEDDSFALPMRRDARPLRAALIDHRPEAAVLCLGSGPPIHCPFSI
jgi:hypothetical protein